MLKLKRFALILLALCSLMACGQKGDLYHPTEADPNQLQSNSN